MRSAIFSCGGRGRLAASGHNDRRKHRRQAGGAAEQRVALTNDRRFANHAARTLLKEPFSCPIRHLPAAASGVLTTTTRQTSPSDTGTVSGCRDRKSTRLNSSHANISYAVFSFKNK